MIYDILSICQWAPDILHSFYLTLFLLIRTVCCLFTTQNALHPTWKRSAGPEFWSDVSTWAQLSHVLRHVTEDEGVKGRVKFEDVTDKIWANDLAALILNVSGSYDCKTKLAAQCYDGAKRSAGASERNHPTRSLFMHYYAHTLNLVMSQGVSKVKDCRILFSYLEGRSAFFTHSPKWTKSLDDTCARRLPHVSTVRRNFQVGVNTFWFRCSLWDPSK